MIIVMLGAQGSGKGTVGVKLAEELGLVHISTGDILREISREDSEIGNYVNETLSSGKLVKDEILVSYALP